MAQEAKTVRFTLMMSPTEFRRLDEYRWENRLSSRAEAVRCLITSIAETKGPAGTAIPPGQGHQPTLEKADERGNQ